MNSELKTDTCDKYCTGCDDFTDVLKESYDGRVWLCEDCNYKYDNKTGYCSVDCCVSANCDSSC